MNAERIGPSAVWSALVIVLALAILAAGTTAGRAGEAMRILVVTSIKGGVGDRSLGDRVKSEVREQLKRSGFESIDLSDLRGGHRSAIRGKHDIFELVDLANRDQDARLWVQAILFLDGGSSFASSPSSGAVVSGELYNAADRSFIASTESDRRGGSYPSSCGFGCRNDLRSQAILDGSRTVADTLTKRLAAATRSSIQTPPAPDAAQPPEPRIKP